MSCKAARTLCGSSKSLVLVTHADDGVTPVVTQLQMRRRIPKEPRPRFLALVAGVRVRQHHRAVLSVDPDHRVQVATLKVLHVAGIHLDEWTQSRSEALRRARYNKRAFVPVRAVLNIDTRRVEYHSRVIVTAQGVALHAVCPASAEQQAR